MHCEQILRQIGIQLVHACMHMSCVNILDGALDQIQTCLLPHPVHVMDASDDSLVYDLSTMPASTTITSATTAVTTDRDTFISTASPVAFTSTEPAVDETTFSYVTATRPGTASRNYGMCYTHMQ